MSIKHTLNKLQSLTLLLEQNLNAAFSFPRSQWSAYKTEQNIPLPPFHKLSCMSSYVSTKVCHHRHRKLRCLARGTLDRFTSSPTARPICKRFQNENRLQRPLWNPSQQQQIQLFNGAVPKSPTNALGFIITWRSS